MERVRAVVSDELSESGSAAIVELRVRGTDAAEPEVKIVVTVMSSSDDRSDGNRWELLELE